MGTVHPFSLPALETHDAQQCAAQWGAEQYGKHLALALEDEWELYCAAACLNVPFTWVQPDRMFLRWLNGRALCASAKGRMLVFVQAFDGILSLHDLEQLVAPNGVGIIYRETDGQLCTQWGTGSV